MNKYLLLTLLATTLAACEPKKSGPAVANERTVIVYMNADNNLYDMNISGERYGALADINEMESAWNNEEYSNTTLLVYLNSGTAEKKSRPLIYRISHDQDNNTINSAVVHRYTDHDAAKPEVLSQVLNDAMQIAPAKSYGLIFWSHGTGWVPMNMGQPLRSGAATYSFGSSSSYGRNEMEIPDLAKALPAGVVFDYIAFDACYMGCIEVAYELRNHCRNFIGSAVETPVDGFEYHKIMKALVTGDSEGIVRNSYEHYKTLQGWWATMAMSSIDCSQLDALAAATKQLVTNTPKGLSELSTAGVQDLSSSSTFRSTYFDFEDFIAINWASSSDLAAFKAALAATVKIKLYLPRNMGNYDIKTYSGYACYAPKSLQPNALEAYRTKFAWSKASGMGDIK